MTTSTTHLNKTASAFAALALTMALAWVFVDATQTAQLTRDGGYQFLSALSALVR